MVLCYLPTSGNALRLWWNTPARIINFESTLVTPATPIKPLASNQARFVWPGIEPADQGAVLQNVINGDGQAGNWSFYPEYCCDPNEFLEGGFPVYPGDLITGTFTLDLSSGIWLDGASITPGAIGIAAAQAPFQASFHFDPQIYPASTVYQMAYLVIELQQGAEWDWGKVIFQDVTTEAETTNRTWCSA
ncbi:hypothetical protein V8E51_018684 [Hyaloscypha variabilis]